MTPPVLELHKVQKVYPGTPPVESLNVAIAGSLILYEAARQRGI